MGKRLRLLTVTDEAMPTRAGVLVELVDIGSKECEAIGVLEVGFGSDCRFTVERIQPDDARVDDIINGARRQNAATTAMADPKSALANIPLDECRRVARLILAYAKELQDGHLNVETASLLIRDYAAHEWNRRYPTGG